MCTHHWAQIPTESRMRHWYSRVRCRSCYRPDLGTRTLTQALWMLIQRWKTTVGRLRIPLCNCFSGKRRLTQTIQAQSHWTVSSFYKIVGLKALQGLSGSLWWSQNEWRPRCTNKNQGLHRLNFPPPPACPDVRKGLGQHPNLKYGGRHDHSSPDPG